MSHTRLILSLSLLCLSLSAPAFACIIADPAHEYTDYTKDCPKDVTAFFARAEECAHFAGEEPYNEARAKEIEVAVRKNRCDTLECDGKKILARYKKQTALYAVLRQGWSQYLKNFYDQEIEKTCPKS